MPYVQRDSEGQIVGLFVVPQAGYAEEWQEEAQLVERQDIGPVPASSAKLVLMDDGLYDEVEELCASHPYAAVRIWWVSAVEWERDHPYVTAIAELLSTPLSGEQIDDMFRRARTRQ